ncbi:MAG: hypothetical protein WBI82_01145 [Sphaerochaeta sp.]
MTAYLLTTSFALPPLYLLAYECLYTIFLHGSEVFNHAHVVFYAIAFVQHFKALTREIGATQSKNGHARSEAVIAHMQTVFTARYAELAILPVEALPFRVVHLRLVTDA